MPTAVLMMIGQIAVMKITKIADGWLSRNAASEIGSQASGGTVRSTWKIGSRPRIAQTRLADQRAERMPTTRRAKPMATRCSWRETRQPSPCPAARVEERIDDQLPGVGSTRFDGGGSVAPASCTGSATRRAASASMISTTRGRIGAAAPAIHRAVTKLGAAGRAAPWRRGGRPRAAASAVLQAAWSSVSVGEHRCGGAERRRHASDFDALDRQALEVGAGLSGSKTLPSKKVSLPREVEAECRPPATPAPWPPRARGPRG